MRQECCAIAQEESAAATDDEFRGGSGNPPKGGSMNLSGKKWNQGDLDQNPVAMQREQANHEVVIDAPVGRVFERACVAGQPGWLRAGSVRLAYTETGSNEKDALWLDSETGPDVFRQPHLETYWTTTRIDPEGYRYQAVLINPGLTVGTLDVTMEGQGNQTLVRFDLSCTVLSEAGSALFDDGLGARLRQALHGFGDTLADAVASESALPVRRESHNARRECVEHQITITGDIDECFALACPVAELEWIDGWSFDLIYSESGRNETGCVFLEPSSGLSMLRLPGANTHWYCNRYDTEQHVFEAVWLTRDLTIANWEVRMTDPGGGQTRVDWSLVYTGLGAAGNRLLDEAGLDQRMKRGLGFLATSLKHYVETGELFRLSGHQKLKVVGSLIGAALGRHLRRQRASESRASARPDQQIQQEV